MPWGQPQCTPKSLKRAIVGPHKQKPRPHMLEGRGFLGIERAAWDSALIGLGGKATYPLLGQLRDALVVPKCRGHSA